MVQNRSSRDRLLTIPEFSILAPGPNFPIGSNSTGVISGNFGILTGAAMPVDVKSKDENAISRNIGPYLRPFIKLE